MAGRKKEHVVDVFLTAPWWISLVFAVALYLALSFVLPPLGAGTPLLRGLAGSAKMLAPYLALTFAVLAPVAYWRQSHQRGSSDGDTGLDSVRALSWKEFEALAGESFRRLGYEVQEMGSTAPGCGIDLLLRRDRGKTIVQCKQWRSRRVGVKPLRDVYDAMLAVKADGALFETSGDYTSEARAFAEDKPIGLINGPALLELVERVRKIDPPQHAATPRREPTLRS